MPALLQKRADVEPPAYPVPEEEIYEARFLNYDEPKPSKFIDKRTQEYPLQVRLVFEIQDGGEFDGTEVSKYVDWEMNALNKRSIYHVLQALDPEFDGEGGESLDDFLDKKCRIEIKHKPGVSKQTGLPVTYANIGTIRPLRKKKTSPNGDEAAEKPAKAVAKKSALDVDDDEE
jgi:hypothetical protein